MQDLNKPLNDKQWQDSSDGWVKTMNESKERKEKKLKNFDFCAHDDFEFCQVCQYDEKGEEYNTEFDNYEAGDWCMLPDVDVFDKHINGTFEQFCSRMWLDNCDENKAYGSVSYTLDEYTTKFKDYLTEKYNGNTTEK